LYHEATANLSIDDHCALCLQLFVHGVTDEEYCAAHIAGVMLRFEELITAQQQQQQQQKQAQQAQCKPLGILLSYSTIRSGESNTIRCYTLLTVIIVSNKHQITC
jgi:hypothetical protein